MEDLVYLGKFIKLQREKRDLNISQFANKVHYSRSYLSQIESGKVVFSENLDTTINDIFTYLNMDYHEYKEKGMALKKNIDNLFKCIFFNLQEERDNLYKKLCDSEGSFISYKDFPRYCLCKFVYNVSVLDTLGNEVETIKKSLIDNISILELKDQIILYTFVGVYYREKANCKKSEYYLNKALEFGDFINISGITYYQLAVTQALENRLVSAYTNIEKSNSRFREENNFKRLIYSQAQQALILVRSKEYKRANNIFYKLLETYQLSNNFKNVILINQAQLHLNLKNYGKALHILNNLKITTDNTIFIKLSIYYFLYDKASFNSFYDENKNKIADIIYKEHSQILYMKINDENNSEEYVNLLLLDLSREKLKYDIDMVLFILDELIEYFDMAGKYKQSNKYLKMKIKLLTA